LHSSIPLIPSPLQILSFHTSLDLLKKMDQKFNLMNALDSRKQDLGGFEYSFEDVDKSTRNYLRKNRNLSGEHILKLKQILSKKIIYTEERNTALVFRSTLNESTAGMIDLDLKDYLFEFFRLDGLAVLLEVVTFLAKNASTLASPRIARSSLLNVHQAKTCYIETCCGLMYSLVDLLVLCKELNVNQFMMQLFSTDTIFVSLVSFIEIEGLKKPAVYVIEAIILQSSRVVSASSLRSLGVNFFGSILSLSPLPFAESMQFVEYLIFDIDKVSILHELTGPSILHNAKLTCTHAVEEPVWVETVNENGEVEFSVADDPELSRKSIPPPQPSKFLISISPVIDSNQLELLYAGQGLLMYRILMMASTPSLDVIDYVSKKRNVGNEDDPMDHDDELFEIFNSLGVTDNGEELANALESMRNNALLDFGFWEDDALQGEEEGEGEEDSDFDDGDEDEEVPQVVQAPSANRAMLQQVLDLIHGTMNPPTEGDNEDGHDMEAID
jgi:hypothetical protein